MRKTMNSLFPGYPHDYPQIVHNLIIVVMDTEGPVDNSADVVSLLYR